MFHKIILVMLASAVPWFELRAAIPYGIGRLKLDPLTALLAAVVASWAMIFVVFVILDLFYDGFLSRYWPIRRVIEEIRTRAPRWVEEWGVLGVGIYVSLPIPGPGIYSGVILAWLFGLPRRQAMVALVLGVLVSGILVTIISTGLIAIWRKFAYP